MKKELFLLFSVIQLLLCSTRSMANAESNSLVHLEILYVSNEASEVYLVWGINNWQTPDSAFWKNGSYMKDKLLFTKMEKKESGFTADLKLPPNTMVDYIFWISRGPENKKVEIWDLNKLPLKDYHSLANNNTALVTPAVIVRPSEAISILDFAKPIFAISAICLLLIVFLKHRQKIPVEFNPVKIIIAFSVMLIPYLIFLRASTAGLSWDLYFYPFKSLSKVLWSAFYDIAFVFVIAGLFIGAVLFLKAKTKICFFLTALFIVMSFLFLTSAIMNIRIVETIGRPFNYAWLYYSDFLKSTDARSAVSSHLTKDYVLSVFLICLSALFSGIISTILINLLFLKPKVRTVFTSGVIAGAVAYFIIAPGIIKNYNWKYDKLANPVIAFLQSITPFSDEPGLFTMNIDDRFKFEVQKNQSAKTEKIHGIKNVIIYVLESTPAEYVQPYSSSFHITPELEKHLHESVIFENIYAHAPSTNNSIISILGSVYPYLSYNSITKERPDIKIPTISVELKKHGYRTAFFNSADNRFQKVNEFLEYRKFDEIKDCSSLKCDKHFEVNIEKWDFQDGKDDQCTAEDLISWINQKPDKPFFAMMWTYQTHYPYFVSDEEKTYVPDPVFNRYLNAVNHNDKVLGKILNELKQNGLYESTLVVVVGDHGEAFGRHEQITHAAGIYEENLHVPCIFINPVFKGEHHKGIGGLVDIAPTIMDLLGHPYANQWLGNNLFAKNENDRVYFFTPWADYLFGYREGSKKYIYNATKNITEMYDLKNDPMETNNISSDFPDNTAVCHQRLAGWVQYINKHMNNLLSEQEK